MIAKKDKNGKMIDKDRAEDIAIEVGAEEVEEEAEEQEASKSQNGGGGGGGGGGEDDGEDVPTWTLYTTARDVQVVKGKIEGLKGHRSPGG